jgi:hypothetical protein
MTTAPTPLTGGHDRRRVIVVALAAFAAGAGAVAVLGGYHGSTATSPGTVRGSGVPAVQTRTVPPFTGVELAGSNNVIVTVGGTQSVVVHADENLLGHVTTVVRDGTLVIGNKGSFSTKSPMHVDVTVPTLVRAVLTGSGNVVATGTAPRLRASLPGSGNLQLGGLAVRDVIASVSGSGRIVVQATRSLHASVSGTGAIFYRGKPTVVTTSVTGNGTVTPG